LGLVIVQVTAVAAVEVVVVRVVAGVTAAIPPKAPTKRTMKADPRNQQF